MFSNFRFYNFLIEMMVYKNQELIPFIKNNFEFSKEAAQIFCLERVTIAEWQGTSEDEKFVAKLT